MNEKYNFSGFLKIPKKMAMILFSSIRLYWKLFTQLTISQMLINILLF